MFEAYDLVPNGTNGCVRYAKIGELLPQGNRGRICNVDLWSHSSCALNTLHNFNSFVHFDGKAFIAWLKTQPFRGIHGWDAMLFTIVPMPEGTIESFCEEFCQPIHEFINHAHGGHKLTLYLLDLTKC